MSTGVKPIAKGSMTMAAPKAASRTRPVSTAAKPNGFPHSEHLTGLEFLRVMAKGEKKSCHSFHLYYMASDHFQAGVCVSRKLGDAVVRNRIKRVLREAIRLSRTALAYPCHVVLMARPGAERLSAPQAQAHLTELYGTARLALAVKS